MSISSILLHLLRFVLWPSMYMSYLGICSMDTWNECVFCCFGVECSINIYLILLTDGVLEFCGLAAFLVQLFYQLLREGCWNLQLCVFVQLFFQFYQFLLYRFCSSVVWCIHNYPVWCSLSFLNLYFMFLMEFEMFSVIMSLVIFLFFLASFGN